MSPPDSTELVRRGTGAPPRADIYTAMLGVALAALLGAIIQLGRELHWQSTGGGGAAAPTAPASATPATPAAATPAAATPAAPAT